MYSYELFLHKSDKPIIVVDRDNRIIFINSLALTQLKITESEVMGKNFFDLTNIGREMLSLEQSYHLPNGHVLYCKDKNDSGVGAIMMHQIKTPLATMKWTLEIVGDNPDLKPELKKLIDDVYYANQYAINLVNNWLQFARIESGNTIVNRKPVEPQKLINNLLAMIRPQADQKNQKFVIELHALPKQLLIDQNIFSHTFLNLVDNAIAYGNENTSVVIAGEPCEDGKYYRFSITDLGVPILAAEKSKLFTKFWRSDAARAVKASGNGIGLYVAKAAAEANGGRIWFESDASGATTFYFTIPV